MSEIARFFAERAAQIREMGADEALRRQSLAWLIDSAPYRYCYNFTWLGRPVIQFPQDIVALQEIVWRTRPEVIVETGVAHYFSRSRGALWKKGETSGQLQIVEELRVDCDQDAVLIKVRPQGDGGACHVGFRSCFYRVMEDGRLVEREDKIA